MMMMTVYLCTVVCATSHAVASNEDKTALYLL